MTTIPHCNVEGNTREETTLSDTESHTRNQETSVVGDETHESHGNTPCQLSHIISFCSSLKVINLLELLTIIIVIHKEGRVFFIIRLLGISAATYHGKKTARAMLYWRESGSIPKSASRPTKRAFPMLVRSKKERLLNSPVSKGPNYNKIATKSTKLGAGGEHTDTKETGKERGSSPTFSAKSWFLLRQNPRSNQSSRESLEWHLQKCGDPSHP